MRIMLPMRRGFTLIETLVALVLFQIGMLAVAASGAVAARDVATARRIAWARDLARNRVEALRAAACAAPSQGSAGIIGGAEHWSVTPAGDAREIVDSVSFALPAGRFGFVVVRGAILCDS
jgi:prepilin-type N-terminal cleavage/methylation domain-containing protein